MKRKFLYLIAAVLILIVGWFSGHSTSPDEHTLQKLGEAQQAYIQTKQAFDNLCPHFLEDQAKLESRLAPGEVLHTYQCAESTSTGQ